MGSIRDQVFREAEERKPSFTLDRRVGPFPRKTRRQQLRELASDPEVRKQLDKIRQGGSA